MSALRDSIEAYTNAAQKAKSDFSKLEKSDPKLVQDVEAILAFRVTPRLEQIVAGSAHRDIGRARLSLSGLLDNAVNQVLLGTPNFGKLGPYIVNLGPSASGDFPQIRNSLGQRLTLQNLKTAYVEISAFPFAGSIAQPFTKAVDPHFMVKKKVSKFRGCLLRGGAQINLAVLPERDGNGVFRAVGADAGDSAVKRAFLFERTVNQQGGPASLGAVFGLVLHGAMFSKTAKQKACLLV